MKHKPVKKHVKKAMDDFIDLALALNLSPKTGDQTA